MLRSFFCITILLTAAVSKGQNFHFTLFGGISNYQGDLQSKKITTLGMHAAFGAGLLYEIKDQLYARAMVSYGKVSASDKDGKLNRFRNLSFSSPLLEGQFGLEYDIFNLYKTTGITPYVFSGVAFFHFNPSAVDRTGNKVNLQPLGTEGQGFYLGRKKYSLTQLSIPVGGGLKIAVNENVRIRLEAGLRKLFTDYLDDVSTTYAGRDELLLNNGQKAVDLAFRSNETVQGAVYPNTGAQRGNPKSKDWYYFATFGLSFRLPSEYGSHSGKSQLGCPVSVY